MAMPRPPSKNPFLDLVHIEEVNKRDNKDFGLFTNYQINPYTKKTLDFVTGKITQRPPKVLANQVNGYEMIRASIWKPICIPPKKYLEPQTEQHRFGWFPPGTGLDDADNYDERFKFTHKTAQFIKTQSMLKEYDRLMAGFVKNL